MQQIKVNELSGKWLDVTFLFIHLNPAPEALYGMVEGPDSMRKRGYTPLSPETTLTHTYTHTHTYSICTGTLAQAHPHSINLFDTEVMSYKSFAIVNH